MNNKNCFLTVRLKCKHYLNETKTICNVILKDLEFEWVIANFVDTLGS